MPEPTTPPGWSYDPSTWSERLPIIGLALVGFAVASYLALYQVRLIPSVWEPFFGRGSETILNSSVSRVLPIPDAALGALGYLLDAVTGAIGGRGRWRRIPWIVILFGLAVGPLGAVSITLVILQPVVFDAWCTLCLASAAISLIMIGPAMDEMLASLQYVKRAYDSDDHSAWRAFFGREHLIEAESGGPVPSPADQGGFGAWAQLAGVVLGLWLMASPAVLDYGDPARAISHIVGPLVVSFAVVATSGVVRSVRWVLIPLGAWLLLAPWVLGYDVAPKLNSLAVGILLIGLACIRGSVAERYGGGWSSLMARPSAARLPSKTTRGS